MNNYEKNDTTQYPIFDRWRYKHFKTNTFNFVFYLTIKFQKKANILIFLNIILVYI